MKSLTQADQQPAFSPPAILVVEPARPLPIHSSLQERKLTMNSNTHPDPFPTLPPPHACRVNLNHSKIIPRKMRGSCTLSQLYQCRLSVDCRTARAKWAGVAHDFDPLLPFRRTLSLRRRTGVAYMRTQRRQHRHHNQACPEKQD